MNSKKLVLGIDTSNYKTSVAICDMDGNVLIDEREFLKVKQGERGLRQSNALFQHIENLPILLEKAFLKISKENIAAICVSNVPRPVLNSYMPCFLAGKSLGKSLSNVLSIPCYYTSHQEGHIAAVLNGIQYIPKSFLAFHISGGTCELLKVTDNNISYEIEIVGGTMDISYGQVLDRIGVALGMSFPSGEEMDRIAIDSEISSKILKKIPINDTYINLSGIETQAQRAIGTVKDEELIAEIFIKIADSIFYTVKNASMKYNLKTVILVGGVSASNFIRNRIIELSKNSDLNFIYGDYKLSSDNAVGVALLGGKKYGNETC